MAFHPDCEISRPLLEFQNVPVDKREIFRSEIFQLIIVISSSVADEQQNLHEMFQQLAFFCRNLAFFGFSYVVLIHVRH